MLPTHNQISLLKQRNTRELFNKPTVTFFFLSLVLILPNVYFLSYSATNKSLADDKIILESSKIVNFEFPYPKTCRFEQAPPGEAFEIALFYHVGMMNNWKRIVKDQLHTLETCGLGYMASSLTISYSVGANSTNSREVLAQILNQFAFTATLNISYVISTSVPWEKEAMHSISRTCHSINNKNESVTMQGDDEKKSTASDTKKKVFVYYFHNKGVSKYNDDSWKDNCQQGVAIWTYCNVIHWRKYMEWFLLEKPTLCLRAMLYHGASTCGVNLHDFPKPHYSGNFWSASCDYVNSLPSLVHTFAKSDNYLQAEMWIGEGIVPGQVNFTKHVSFFETYDIHGDGIGLYRSVISPYQYSNVSKHKEGKYSAIWFDYLGALNET